MAICIPLEWGSSKNFIDNARGFVKRGILWPHKIFLQVLIEWGVVSKGLFFTCYSEPSSRDLNCTF